MMDIKNHIYRKKRLKDSSNRNLLIRADKRERFLAYAYIRGDFLLPEDHDSDKIMLKIYYDPQKSTDCIMLKLLDEVIWFKRHKTVSHSPCYVVYRNGDGKDWDKIAKTFGKKTYMKRLYKIVHLSRSKGIQYLYTPLTFFAWLTAPQTRFHKDGVSIHVRSEDKDCIIDWLHYGGLEEVTGNDSYNINAREIVGHPQELFISNEDVFKMIRYVSKDKYVGKYKQHLVNYIEEKKNGY